MAICSVHGIMGHDAWVSSVLIVSLSVTALVAFAEWEEWGLLIIGLWLAMSPWVLGFQNATAMKVNVGVGFVVAYLAAMDLWLIHYDALPPLEPSVSISRHAGRCTCRPAAFGQSGLARQAR